MKQLIAQSNRARQLVLANAAYWAIPLFAIAGLIGLWHHAMWRDELNTWLIVRDSSSLAEILGYVNYQGHTPLWAMSVTVIQQVFDRPWAMQGFHWLVAMVSVGIFWRYGPFTNGQKVLFTFGFLPLYQYLLISRPYVLGMAALFAACALFSRRRRTYLPLAVALALLANSHAYGLFVTVAMTGVLMVEWLLSAEQRSKHRQLAPGWNRWVSLLVVVLGVAIAVYILAPPMDSANHGGVSAWVFTFDLRRLLRSLCRVFAGYLLIVPTHERWLDASLGAIASVGLIGATAFYLRRFPYACLFYLSATGIVLVFTYTRFIGLGPRHYGQFYLILIAALWLASHYGAGHTKPVENTAQRSSPIRGGYGVLVMLILWVQCLAGIGRYAYNYFLPFSASRAASDYILEQGWNDEFIVGSRDAQMAPIAGYLDRSIYYPERQKIGSFTLFTEDRKEDVTYGDIFSQIQQLLEQDPSLSRVLLILHRPLEIETDAPDVQGLTVTPDQSFTHSQEEEYHLFWVER
ncbi:MAG: hypothetical protein AAFY78_08195 [Cyanobacteria bacterium J06648_16]